MKTLSLTTLIQIVLIVIKCHSTTSTETNYLRSIKDACFLRGDAFACIKYKALKIAKKTIFDDNTNSTIKANSIFSLVPLDNVTIGNITEADTSEVFIEPRGILSEWSEIAKYFMKLVQEFFKMRGLRMDLPEGARAVEDQDNDDGRSKKKKLAIIIPFLTLLAALKAKLLLIPILLTVLLIKKLLLVAALLLPNLLSTLKHCKHHHSPHYSFFGSESSDVNSDYGNYQYSSGMGYGKDWASNRAYALSKPRPSHSPVYMTAPGTIA